MGRRKMVVKTIDEQIEELKNEILDRKERIKELEKQKRESDKEALYKAMESMNIDVEMAIQKIKTE